MLHFSFNYYTVSLLIGAFTAFISGFIVIMRDTRRLENQAWFALTMCTAIWSTGYFYMTVAQTHQQGFIGNWILHYAAIFIPLFYYITVLIVTNTLKQNRTKIIIYTVIAFLFTAVNLSPVFVADVVPKVGFNYAPVPGPLYILFFIYFVGLVIDGLVNSIIIALRSTNSVEKARLWYTVIFTIAASVGGGSVFATTFLTVIPPYPLILFSIYPAISGYAILRYQLFNVKVVTAQLFTFSLWIIVFLRMLLSDTVQEQIVNAVLLAIVIGLGLLLNRSVKQEVSQRERIELLASDLQSANDNQTNLIHVMNHQIKGKLTDAKAAFAELLTDDYGVVPDAAKVIAKQGLEQSQLGVEYVQGILRSLSAENGSLPYDMKEVDLKTLVKKVTDKLVTKAKDKGLTFEVNLTDGDYMITADTVQLGEAIGNLINNSISYTPSGSIHVWLTKKGTKALIAVQDTGIGISDEDKTKLFKSGGRGKDSIKVNVNSTGYGLSFVKGVVEAHKGRVWAESDGPKKGSSFYVELPLG